MRSERGLVASLVRPGGNLTGVSFLTVELLPKLVELLSSGPHSARHQCPYAILAPAAERRAIHLVS